MFEGATEDVEGWTDLEGPAGANREAHDLGAGGSTGRAIVAWRRAGGKARGETPTGGAQAGSRGRAEQTTKESDMRRTLSHSPRVTRANTHKYLSPMATLQQRIAALQQRSAAPQPPPSTAHPPAPSSLRDKIARFDKKGGLPVPARRAADLYANRAPRPSGGDSTLASEQTNTPLLQSDVNERTLTATEANEQTLLQSTALSKLQSEANEQTLLQSTANTPLLQSTANTTLLHSTANTPLLQSMANTTLLQSTANTPLLQSTANTLLHSKTNTPSSQSAAHERQSAPILAVNDQDQTPSSPTTPHAPTFNLSSALGQHSPAATSPERVPPIATDDDQQTLAQDEPKSVSSNFTATIQFSEPSSSPLTKTSTDDDQRTLTQETQISRDEPKSSFRAAIHHQTVPPSPPLTKTSIDDDQQTLAQDEPKSVSSNFRATIHHEVSEPPSSLLTKTSDHGKAIDDDQQTLAQETRISRDEPKSSFKATIHHQVSEPPSPPLTKSSTNDDQQTLAQDEPKLRSSFRATIHHKAPEPSLSPQSTTPIRRVASAVPLGSGTTLDQKPGAFPSLVFGDLADLLQSTVLLQERLDNSPVSPSETTIANSGVPVIVTDEDHDDTDLQSPDTNLEVRRLSKEEVEENKRTLWKLQAKREEQARSKVRNGFFGPFGRASKDVSRETLKGMSIDGAAVPSQQQQLYSKRSKSPSILNTAKDIKSSLDAPGEDNLHPKTLENQSTGSPSGKTSGLSPKSPPKSPKSGLSAFRLLASRSSPSSAQDCRHGSHGRNSVSTSSEFSSEDSALSVVTPPDDVNEFGGLRSWLSMGSSQSKKGGDVEERDRHISRAVSFKFWQRARTRSGASTRSVQSLRGEFHIPTSEQRKLIVIQEDGVMTHRLHYRLYLII